MRSPFTMNITTIGSHARRMLGQNARGRVAAVFEHGCYLRHESLPLLCLMPQNRSPGPINLLYADDGWDGRRVMKVDDQWECRGSALQVGNVRFLFDRAAIWRARGSAPDWSPCDLAEGLKHAADSIPFANTGVLLPLVLNRHNPGRAPHQAHLAKRAQLGIGALRRWLAKSLKQRAHTVEIPDEGEVLIGLGHGLTPAGDDFIVGMLVALYGLQFEGVARALAAWVRRKTEFLTNEISASHLLVACDGGASAPVHDSLDLLTHPKQPGLSECMAALAKLGHSSGWDAFSGVLAVCQCVVAASVQESRITAKHSRSYHCCPEGEAEGKSAPSP